MFQYDPVLSLKVPYGPEWSCMVPYSPIWSRIVPYCPVWSRTVPWSLVYSHILLIVQYGPARFRMVLYGSLWSCVPVWSHVVTYGPVWLCMVHGGLDGLMWSRMVCTLIMISKKEGLRWSTTQKYFRYVWLCSTHATSAQILCLFKIKSLQKKL